MLEVASPGSSLGDSSTENSSADMNFLYEQFLGVRVLL
jgi:hypothetical protein